MLKRIVLIFTVIALISIVAFTLAANKREIDAKKQVVDRSHFTVGVKTVPAEKEEISGNVSLPANLEANKDAKITAFTQGRIESFRVEPGTRVAKGQVVGHIDTKLRELSLKTTQLTIDKLEQDVQRYKELYEGKAVTEVNYLDMKYNYENSRLQAEQIEKQIEDGKIVSPISGIVTGKNVEPGEFANPGAVLATVVDISRLKAVVMVDEQVVYQLENGQKAEIKTDLFPGKTFNGTISYISPEADNNHNYRVEVTIPNHNETELKAGAFVMVDFQLSHDTDVLMIPKIALIEGVKNPAVYVVEEGIAHYRKIVLGRENGERIEAVSGLNQGEEVIISGQINLADGSPVEIIK